MAFVLAKKTDSFFYPINLPIVTDAGASQTARFEFRFKRLSRSRLNALQKAQEAASDQDVDTLERDVDYVMDIADGWKGVEADDGPVEFNRENVAALLDNYPNAAGEIVKAFFEATLGGGRKTKN
jgi:hypothetical protein